MWKLCPPLLKFLATPLPALVVDEENLVIGLGSTLEMLPPSLLGTIFLASVGGYKRIGDFRLVA